jgi:hypothetical protein
MDDWGSVSHIAESGLTLLFGYPYVSGLLLVVEVDMYPKIFLFLLLFFTLLIEVSVHFCSYFMSED